MSAPKVSFIIPFYNNGDTLPETMESVRRQDYSTFDVWIINDGSTDPHSLEVLDRYKSEPGVTVLHQINAGPSIARNLAISQTDADIIVPLDSDDLIRPGALSLAMRTLSKHPEADIIYSDLQLFGHENRRKNQPPMHLRQLLLSNPVGLCTFIRKNVFDDIGYFDEFMSKKGLEDWEFWIRALSHEKHFYHIPELLFDIRVRPSSRTYTQANLHLQELKDYVHQKHLHPLVKEYEKMLHHIRWLESTPAVRLMDQALWPWRKIKGALRKTR
ncbi:MAG: glycosyltransferase [Bacteroidetes bacterium]|nr:glycosyltransferase [Bacteroidota bacterium]